MPQFFNNIIGNEKLKRMLSSYIANDNMPHAFVIEGPVGSGRKLLANSIAAALSCKNRSHGQVPCMSCINCEKIFLHVCPDVMTIDTQGKQTIGVDLVRELSAHTYMSSNELDIKAYIIDGADKMTIAAQNAFLKTLEEPVTDVLYFLVCENSGMLLPTIISRAPIVRTCPLAREEVFVYLQKKYPALPTETLTKIAAVSRGNLGRAITLSNDTEALEELQQERQNIYLFFDLFKKSGAKFDIIDYFTSNSEKNRDEIEHLRLLYSAFRDIIVYKELNSATFDFFIDAHDASNYANAIKTKSLKKMCIYIENAIESLTLNQGTSSTSSILFTLANSIRSTQF